LVSVYTGGWSATSEDLTMVGNILSVGGITEMVPEYLINAAGAVASSGPAFVSITGTGDSLSCR
jgi:Pyrroline-5-carboxylate reductase